VSLAARVPLKKGRDQWKARHPRESHKLSFRGSEYGSADGSGGRGGMFARNQSMSLYIVEEGGRYGGWGALSIEISVIRFGLALCIRKD
jgi:hypothetical protein